jgi:hypothetical protein
MSALGTWDIQAIIGSLDHDFLSIGEAVKAIIGLEDISRFNFR